MKPEFVKCDYCKAEIPLEQCEMATYRMMIDGKEYVFCCASCAKRYQTKKKSPKK
jgi:YHS domain-containing protein